MRATDRAHHMTRKIPTIVGFLRADRICAMDQAYHMARRILATEGFMRRALESFTYHEPMRSSEPKAFQSYYRIVV